MWGGLWSGFQSTEQSERLLKRNLPEQGHRESVNAGYSGSLAITLLLRKGKSSETEGSTRYLLTMKMCMMDYTVQADRDFTFTCNDTIKWVYLHFNYKN